jgi:hypothetical protein
MRRTAAIAAAIAAVIGGAAACGPYAPLAQKLDVTGRIVGDAWIAAAGLDRSGTRILLLGRPDADGNSAFAFSDLPSGVSDTSTIQGTWSEPGLHGDVTLVVRFTYVLPGGGGATRDEDSRTLHATASRAQPGRLVVSGDPAVAGTYVRLADALRNLGTPATITPQCAFLIPNLAVMTSQIRIPGFGGNSMYTYQQAADFIGTVAGNLNVSVNISLTNNNAHTVLRYDGFEDFGGVTLNGPIVTDTTLSANGHMSGVLRFALAPAATDPASVATPIQGSINYGSPPSTDPIQISGAKPGPGGAYWMSIDGGFSNSPVPVAIVNTASSAVADCLALP